jgi:glucosylceramidase
LWAVTVQNEPEFPAPWEACAYTPKAQADFVAYHLGPQLQEDHPDVKLLMFDHNKDHMITWAKLLLNKTAHPAHKYIQGTAYHWYAGGMDRLLDGSVGSPNLHRFQATLEDLFQNKTKKHDDHVILGSEACHCPYTGYAGGDIETYWARAERYAHSILADLAAGSNGWVEWNLVLDSVGGPNHLNNLCDTGILAVPHRAIVNETKSTIPPTLSFEKTNHSFGVNVGDSRTRAELNALGFPAKFLDDGLAVQPIYYYMGHISRYVRPGSRALQGLVEEAKAGVGKEQEEQAKEKYRAFRSPGQVVAGGGFNEIARNGIELTAWPCEGSTRQVFEWTSTKRIDVLGHDWLGKPTKSCVAREVDVSFKGVTLTDCKARLAATFDLVEVPAGEYEGHVKFVQTNVPRDSELSNRCLVLGTLGNGGGALGPRGGAQVMYGSCASPGAMWKYEEGTRGEITSSYLEEGEVCMTTGWPFLQMGAFSTPNGESDNTVVLLNEARDSANYVLYNGDDVILSGSIPPRSIQTVLLDSN